MNKQILLILILFASIQPVFSVEYVSSYTITKRSTVTAIPDGKSVFKFTFYKPNGKKVDKKLSITLSVNGQTKYTVTDTNGVGFLSLDTGKYCIHISTYSYEEIKVDSIQTKSQEKIEITVNFEFDDAPRPMKKPVIYVYARHKTQMSILMEVNGPLLFSYPDYNLGWNFTAMPGGLIKMNGVEYNYLFWEGGDGLAAMRSGNMKEGYVVGTDTLLRFLENCLTTMGFNSKEKQDFITYWYPQMQKNDANCLRFIFNDACNVFAKLNIVPNPDNVFRVSIIWAGADGFDKLDLNAQTFPVINRNGLCVIEWGGVEMPEMEIGD